MSQRPPYFQLLADAHVPVVVSADVSFDSKGRVTPDVRMAPQHPLEQVTAAQRRRTAVLAGPGTPLVAVRVWIS